MAELTLETGRLARRHVKTIASVSEASLTMGGGGGSFGITVKMQTMKGTAGY